MYLITVLSFSLSDYLNMCNIVIKVYVVFNIFITIQYYNIFRYY